MSKGPWRAWESYRPAARQRIVAEYGTYDRMISTLRCGLHEQRIVENTAAGPGGRVAIESAAGGTRTPIRETSAPVRPGAVTRPSSAPLPPLHEMAEDDLRDWANDVVAATVFGHLRPVEPRAAVIPPSPAELEPPAPGAPMEEWDAYSAAAASLLRFGGRL